MTITTKTYNAHNFLYKYTYSFNELFWVDNAPSKSQRPSNKKSSTRCKKPSFELLVKAASKISKTFILLPLPTRSGR